MADTEFKDLLNKDKKAVTDILVSCGLKENKLRPFDRESLHELIGSLRGAPLQCFAKVFAKHLGRSGGTVDCICPHLIEYAILFIAHAESPRDIANLLALFKHLPHCAFYDFWCGGVEVLEQALAARGVHLGERRGAVVEEDKFDELKQFLPISVPELNMECAPSMSLADAAVRPEGKLSIDVDRLPHEVTQSRGLATLHDDFHGNPHKRCNGRRPDNILEARTFNGSRQEHLNRTRLLHDPFLRNQAFHRYYFLHLVIAHCRNKAINEEALERLQYHVEAANRTMPQFEWRLVFNERTGRMEIHNSPRE